MLSCNDMNSNIDGGDTSKTRIRGEKGDSGTARYFGTFEPKTVFGLLRISTAKKVGEKLVLSNQGNIDSREV